MQPSRKSTICIDDIFPEIMLEIFDWFLCLSDGCPRSPYQGPIGLPLLLVCKHWNVLAVSCPALWSSPRVHMFQGLPSKQWWQDFSKQLVDRARKGAWNLTLTLGEHADEDEEDQGRNRLPLAGTGMPCTTLEFAQNLQTVSLRMPYWHFLDFAQGQLGASEEQEVLWSVLEGLSMSCYPPREPVAGSMNTQYAFAGSKRSLPNLRVLILSGFIHPLQWTDIPWENLNSLVLHATKFDHGGDWYHGVMQVLERCVSLESFAAKSTLDAWVEPIATVPAPSTNGNGIVLWRLKKPIVLHRLKEFILHLVSTSADPLTDIDCVLDSLHLPSLEYLSLWTSSHVAPWLSAEALWRLLEPSKGILVSLTLQDIRIPDLVLIRVLDRLNNLQVLEVACPTRVLEPGNRSCFLASRTGKRYAEVFLPKLQRLVADMVSIEQEEWEAAKEVFDSFVGVRPRLKFACLYSGDSSHWHAHSGGGLGDGPYKGRSEELRSCVCSKILRVV